MRLIRDIIRQIILEQLSDEEMQQYKKLMFNSEYAKKRRAYLDSIQSFDDISVEDIPTIIDYIGTEGFNSDEDGIEELKELITFYQSLPDVVTLYRVVALNDKQQLNIKEPGEHYVVYREYLDDGDFLLSIGMDNWDEELKPYILTVKVSKYEIDVWQTLVQNMSFPNEHEVNLKNKGRAAKIISVEKMNM